MAHRDRNHKRSLDGQLLRFTAYLCVVLGAVWFLVSFDLSAPRDIDAWSPGALQGDVVHSLMESRGVLFAGAHSGLYELHPDGSVKLVSGVPGPVYTLEDADNNLYAGTGDGVYSVSPSESSTNHDGLASVQVRDLAFAGTYLYAATDEGLYERQEQGDWLDRWPENGMPEPVNAVLARENGAVIGTEEGISSIYANKGLVNSLWDGGPVVALARSDAGSAAGEARIWAGTRGDPLLLRSEDAGESWREFGDEIRLDTVHAMSADPSKAERLFVGGSGLADGTGTAGVMNSDDGGKSWRTEQNRLSNTHVLSLLAREEVLTVEVSLPPVIESRSLALPVDGTRFYAGTNGSGVYTYRVPGSLIAFLGVLQPGVRLLEPLLAGLLLLIVTWKVYYRRRSLRASEREQSRFTKG